MNAVFESLGIDVPIFQAPIGSLTTPELAAAVSNAGGLGQLACTWRSTTELDELFSETRALTKRAFGANFVLDFPIEDKLSLALACDVKVVSFFWGDGSKYLDRIKDAGAISVQVVSSIRDAILAAHAGFDIIVAQGREAGGHVQGHLGLMALLPQVVDAAGPIPVLAAGGIGDRRGVAAALELGAAGVWVGTRFIATPEANAHPRYREEILAATADDTVYSKIFDVGWSDAPMRTIRNSTVDICERADTVSGRPGEQDVVARTAAGREIPRYHFAAPTRQMNGNIEAMAMYAGEGVGLVRSVEPAEAVVRDLSAGLRKYAIDARP